MPFQKHVIRAAGLAAGVILLLATAVHANNLETGAKLFGEGKYAEAVKVLKEAAGETPDNAKVWLVLASTLEKLEKWSEAAEAWKKVAEHSTNDGEKTYAEKQYKVCLKKASKKDDPENDEDDEEDDEEEDLTNYSRFEVHGDVFQSYRSTNFVIMCKNEALGKESSKEAERHLKRISKAFLKGQEWPHVITVRIHKNHTEYVKEAGAPQWSGGGYSFADLGPGNTLRRVDLFALDRNDKYVDSLLTKTLPHELTHLIIHEYFGQRVYKGLPLALNEGLAMYSEEGTAVLYEAQLIKWVKKGFFFKLDDLYRTNRYPRGRQFVFYSQAASCTRFIIERMTNEQFNVFLDEVKEGNSANSALQTALAQTGDILAGIQKKWLKALMAKGKMLEKKAAEEKAKRDKEKAEERRRRKESNPVTVEDDEEEEVIIKEVK